MKNQPKNLASLLFNVFLTVGLGDTSALNFDFRPKSVLINIASALLPDKKH